MSIRLENRVELSETRAGYKGQRGDVHRRTWLAVTPPVTVVNIPRTIPYQGTNSPALAHPLDRVKQSNQPQRPHIRKQQRRQKGRAPDEPFDYDRAPAGEIVADV